MECAVTLFRNSGFNANNIPDSAELLINSNISRTEVKGDLKSLQINQDVQLDALSVRCSLSQAKNVDFIMLTDDDPETSNKFYAVVGRQMEATDVCTFTIRQIALLSYGGINDLNILDGITERVHVGDDNKFYACEGDPLLNPTQPLEIVDEWAGPDPTDTLVIAECTVDPIGTIKEKRAITVVYEDPVTGEKKEVTYPALSYPENETEYGIGQRIVSTGTTLYVARTSNTSIDPLPNVLIKDGLGNLQGLGVAQGAIIRQYEFPREMSNGITQEGGILEPDKNGIIKRIIAKRTEYSLSEIPNAIKKTAKNKLVTYSPVQKFGMMTVAGNSAEFNLEDMRDNNNEICYNISMRSDPRPDGMPYYRPQWLNGKMAGSNNYKEFWRNCIKGMQWKQVPLVFTEASGNALNTQRFQNNYNMRAENYVHDRNMNISGAVRDVANGIFGMLGVVDPEAGKKSSESASHFAQREMSSTFSKISAGANMAIDLAERAMTFAHNKKMFGLQNTSELYDLYTENNIIAPTVMFPYNSDAVRDDVGNKVLCYQYKYSDIDYDRIDKLLTMYGYRIAKPLEKTDFTNRRYFNFVACQNVSVTGHSQWVNDAIARELKDGVRVWHVLPNKSYYNDNPIR